MSSTGFQHEGRDCHDLRVSQPGSQEGLRKSAHPLTFTLERAVPYLDRAIPALFLGTLYLVLAFVMGWEIGSLFFALLILALVAFFAIAALATVLPIDKPWFYPLMFSLPSLTIGLIAIGDNFTFLSIGLAAMCAGGGSEYFVRWRARR